MNDCNNNTAKKKGQDQKKNSKQKNRKEVIKGDAVDQNEILVNQNFKLFLYQNPLEMLINVYALLIDINININ